ncbi:MAG: hypothetical protein ACOCYU_04550 [Brevefilum sp.]
MTAYLETLALVDIAFLLSALLGALGILIATVWLAIAGGFGKEGNAEKAEKADEAGLARISPLVLGFLMMFGVVGLALRQLVDADPLWAVLGALGAGVLLVGVIVSVAARDR